MSDEQSDVDAMTRRIQAAVLPVIEGANAEIVMPAMIQVLLSLVMYATERGPFEAADSIIATLEDAKRTGAN